MLNRTLVCLLAGLTLALGGCVTAPTKASSNDCLVVIPTSMVNETGQMFARNYFLQFSDGRSEQMIPQFATDTILVVVHSAGTKVVGLRSVVDVSKNFRGPDGFMKVDVELPYVPGRLVIAETGFELEMIKHDSQSYSSSAVPRKVPAERYDALWTKYQNAKDFAPWFAD